MAILLGWDDVMVVGSIAESIWPQGQDNGIRPACLGKEKLLPCLLSEVMDGWLGNTILVVGIGSTAGDPLLALLTVL